MRLGNNDWAGCGLSSPMVGFRAFITQRLSLEKTAQVSYNFNISKVEFWGLCVSEIKVLGSKTRLVAVSTSQGSSFKVTVSQRLSLEIQNQVILTLRASIS